ncbi:hypothetical protein GCM10022245_06070 [Streptomyces mayteni]
MAALRDVPELPQAVSSGGAAIAADAIPTERSKERREKEGMVVHSLRDEGFGACGPSVQPSLIGFRRKVGRPGFSS